MVLEQDVHAIVTTVWRNKYKGVCVCVCVSGVSEEKGRENGREKRTPKNTIGSEVGDFCRLHYTWQLRGQKYMYS